MGFCAVCGLEIIPGRGELCVHHAAASDGWAENNRRMCDLLHRGRVQPRLLPAEREDEFWAHDEVA
jgi:ribosomal protein L24E